MTEHGIQWYLQQWGVWQRIAKNPIPRYVSPAYAIMAQNVEQQGRLPSCLIDDDLALGIDGLVCRLRLRHPQLAVIIEMYYRDGLSDEAVADKTGCSRKTALKDRQSAEHWLDGVWHGLAA